MMVLVALLALLGLGLRPVAANNLEGVGVTRLGDSIAVTITTSADCEYNAFLTDSKPERIVVDLSGVLNDLPQKQFVSLPLKSLRSIRTSQFRSEPDLQARVVLDIKRPIDFRSFRKGNSVVVTFPAVPDEQVSVNWESSGMMQAAVTEPIPVKPEHAMQSPVVQPPQVAEARPVQKPIQKSPEKPIEQPEAKAEETPVEVAQTASQASVEIPAEKPLEVAQKPAENTPEQAPVTEALPDDESEAVAQSAVTTPVESTRGIEVDTTPKRKMIEYVTNDEKDPFVPLVGLGKGNIKEGLPSLENLKLVGILEDDKSIGSALLEDSDGNGYILKPNDKVQSGFLVSVTENKAIFQVSEYGWTRTVALELQVPEIR
jgi:hypothetical protein